MVSSGKRVIWIGYTTQYREGGPAFERAARTMADERAGAADVRCERVESKRDFVDAMRRIGDAGELLDELHFMGHGGMYGPMFRTTAMPEQFSPHEWRTLHVPFAAGARAYFHACRSARWFAPFFARTFGVRAYGYHWYTTFSTRRDAFRWSPIVRRDAPLYLVACRGRKSHGLLGSLAKYSGLERIEALKEFAPQAPHGDTTYDAVAELYDRAFDDIRVRQKEWRFIERNLPASAKPRVLDIGCGNGALLSALRGRIGASAGVDRSPKMIELARRRLSGVEHVEFQAVAGPSLPFADGSFDVVVSLLSFRYLDWDPLMNEIRRVLAPGGKILIIDMVTVPARPSELLALVRDKLAQQLSHRRRPEFAQALRALVTDPRFTTMLEYNPIRAEHELKWYLESRFPGRRVQTLDIAHHTRTLAFDSGPLEPGWTPPQSYP